MDEVAHGMIRTLSLACLLLAAACTGSIELEDGGTFPLPDAGLDAADPGADPGLDAANDAGLDAAGDEEKLDGADGAPDAGTDAGADPGRLDGADAGADPGCVPACTGRECGSDGCGGSCGSCAAGEQCADGLCRQPGGCEGVVCEEKEWCLDGICRCQSGWERQGDACAPILPGDFNARTPESVCAKWNADYPVRAAWVWQEGQDTCDPGVLSAAAIDDAVRRINLFRWLVGLAPVFNQRDLNVYAQPCAVMMKENGDLNHQPPADWACYTSEGAGGASHSNLAMGPRNPAGAIDAYIGDNNVSSLGHRRWILDPPYLPAGIGHTTSWNCTYVMTGGNQTTPDWVAYPPTGPVPRAAILGKWSLGAWGFDDTTTSVTVRDLTAGGEQQPSFYFPGGWYGSYSYLAFSPTGIQAGHDYEVTITDVRAGSGSEPQDLTYTVQVVDCP